MRTFFSSTFMQEEPLRREGIYHPIKLEYYKIVQDQNKKEEAKYGIEIVKKEYKKEGLKIEKKKKEHISNSEEQIEKIINKLEENEVTPVTLKYIIKDMRIQN